MFRKAYPTPKMVFEKKHLYFPLGFPPVRFAFVSLSVCSSSMVWWGGDRAAEVQHCHPSPPPPAPQAIGKLFPWVESLPVMLWLDSGFPGPLAGVLGIVFRRDWGGKPRCSGYWWHSARWPWLGVLLCDCVLGAAAHSAEKTGKKLQCLFSSEKKHLEDFFKKSSLV